MTWKSKKQLVIAISCAEAEFKAMTQGICELLWMKISKTTRGLQDIAL